ncbi:MAG: glycoside hydrolase family 97 protein, partial [Candidatus Aminicenantes bacterium]|nr:glycoside hydrolase family 97 protein [Candidatus Aminicenantes bacterium]
VRNSFRGARVLLESSSGIHWGLELRAYDDGVAFRYDVPEQPNLTEIVLEAEATEFRLAGNPDLLMTVTDSLAWSHERLYTRTPLALVPEKCFIEMPLLAVWPDGTSAALTEAAVRGFAGMYLRRDSGTDGPFFRAHLSPRLDRPGAAVLGRTPLTSPWRVVMLADAPGRQVESNLLVCLNDPPRGDYSWLQPGKSTWHWWNGTADDHLPKERPLESFDYHREYIDFCARHGIAYHSVVADNKPWYRQTREDFAPGPETDITQPRSGLDLPRTIAYAKERGVGIRLWVHWRPLDERLEEAFSRYEEWGVRGLMVDFLDRDDQEMVSFCERVLEAAARHKLHIQFHGSYKPSGEQRTFPNLFNREGVRNLEYLKWGMTCDPQHNVDVAFTRALAGPTDYHLGGFHSVPRSEFRPRNIHPVVLGTRCHHLALYVVYENPMPMVCDAPSAYEGQPGFEFIEEVPTTWDETRFLAGEVGESMVVARRSGTTWYLGGITNGKPRRLAVPLPFLGSEAREAILFRDGSMNEYEPNAVVIERREVRAGMPLEVDLAAGGGFTAVIATK